MSNKHHERRESGAAKAVGFPSPESGDSEASVTGSPVAAIPVAEAPISEAEEFRLKEVVLEARIASLIEESSSFKDQYLRKLADYENFRKRMFREREDSLKYANFGLLGDLVPLLDDFDRAIASAEHARDYQTLHDGIVLIRRQIGTILENKYGLARFESLGRPFDPNVHEAVASEPGEVDEPVVSLEFLPGYRLHDRIIRSAKVRVRMPGATQPTASVEADAEKPGGTGED
jgi:molecular chaperone GrpE